MRDRAADFLSIMFRYGGLARWWRAMCIMRVTPLFVFGKNLTHHH